MIHLSIAKEDSVENCPPADSPSLDGSFILPDAPVHIEIDDSYASDGIVDPPQTEGESRAPGPEKNGRKRARKVRKPSAPKPRGVKTLKVQPPERETPPGDANPSVSPKIVQAGGKKPQMSTSSATQTAAPTPNTSCLPGVQVVEAGMDVEPRASSPAGRKRNRNRTARTLQTGSKSVKNDGTNKLEPKS
ncbi:unnamed protein product, partial [Dicrocoelium dendriticum]